MKKITKFLAIALASLSCVSAFACSGGGGGDDPDGRRILKFEFLKAGYGVDGYQALANAFMKENPDVLVKLIPNYNIGSTTPTKLEANNNLSDVFLIPSTADIKRWAIKDWVEPLDSVYEAEVAEGMTLAQSMNETAREASYYNGHYYFVPEYVSVNGLVYNKGMFEKYGWEVPTTTTELEALCEQIVEDTNGKVDPFTYCGAAAQGYLYFAVENWMVEYEGVTNMEEFYTYSSPEVFAPANSQGKVLAMENLKKFFFDDEGKWVAKNAMGKDHMEAQTDFLLGEAAMMLNGSWFQTEMKEILAEVPDFKLGMMKMPAMSDASGNVMHAEDYVAETDADGNEMGVTNNSIGAAYFIAKNAANKEDAKKFLEFINRPENCALYTSYTNAVRPLTYDKDPDSETYADMSTFCKDVLRIANENYSFTSYSHSPISLMGVIGLWPQGNNWNYKIYENPSQYTPTWCVQSDYAYVKENWDYWQSLVGNN